MTDCVAFVLESPSTTVTFDSATPDDSGLVWTWTDIEGWWEPPAPDRQTLDGLGISTVSVPTAQRWQNRAITLKATVACGGDPDSLGAARDTLTALCDMLRTAGTLTSIETVSKRASVLLADRPTQTVIGEALQLEVTIPLVAHDPLRTVVSDSTRVL